MTVKSSIEIFNENYPLIIAEVEKAARLSGRNPEDIILLAATKTVDAETVNHAIKSGLRFIGENKVQELQAKFPLIVPDVHKHFIGHLQTNKVKYIVDQVEMIESVDSIRLAEEINRRCADIGKVMDILLEVNIGGEGSKSGFAPEDVFNAAKAISKFKNVCVKGLMTIPPAADPEATRKYFAKMKQLFVDIGEQNIDNIYMKYLSMGMSSDFAEAIEEGANIVRVGTALFGERFYLRSDV